MASDKQRILRAARRYGRTLDPIAQRYTDPVTGKRLSGEALILKTVEGESTGLTGSGRDKVSSAGARGWAQFMPGTRAGVIKQFGVDPWRSPEEAVHALTLHMRGKLGNATGLEGYNPGGGSGYVNYILGQRIGSQRAAGGGGGGGGAPTRAGGAPASSGAAVATPQANPNAAFNPGALAQAMAAPQLERPQLAPSSGVAMPGILTPDFYQPIPTSGPPAPPPELDLTPQVSGQDVTFGGPAGKAPDGTVVPAAPAAAGDGGRGGDGGDGGRGGRVVDTGGYPLGRRGKVIGVPHAGTHTLGNWQSDNAVDISIPVGTAMVAPESGVVVKIRHHPQNGGRFAGDQITIRGKNNSYFLAHGTAAKGLRPGQKVKAGQVVGKSGAANGVPHLHIGVEHGDPRKIFGR